MVARTGRTSSETQVGSKKEQAKQLVEQDRYLKALRALVSEKGQQMNTSEWKDRFFEDMEI